MIRFLQRDSRVVKAFFVVIIGMASVSMVVYLIPGLTGQSATAADTYAVVYPHWYSRFVSSGSTVSQQKVEKMARAQLAQQRYPDNPMILGLFEQRVGQQLIQQQILLDEAGKLGIRATNDDVLQYLHTGQAGQVLFPNGNYIGDDQYANLIATRFNMSVPEFEDNVRDDIVIRRLQALMATRRCATTIARTTSRSSLTTR
jgi:peptidyl-prolyl cis-trans isomerase D